jgi:hypothetical protein
MKTPILSFTLLDLAAAVPQALQKTTTTTEAITSSTTTAVIQDVPQATSIAEVAVIDVTIPVKVSQDLLNSIPLNADATGRGRFWRPRVLFQSRVRSWSRCASMLKVLSTLCRPYVVSCTAVHGDRHASLISRFQLDRNHSPWPVVTNCFCHKL